MPQPEGVPPRRRLYRFGPYEFDADSQTLVKHGLRLKIQGKPLQLLEALLENPGRTAPREELQRRLWPADTFVDFETGLNTAAKRLRAALSDSADHPVYIETLARTGYRFIAPVQEVSQAAAVATPAVVPVPAPMTAMPVAAAKPRVPARAMWVAGAAAALVTAASFLAARAPHQPAPVEFRQLTFGRGAVFGAAFGPDGQSVIYSAQWDPAEPRQLYLSNGVSPESRALGWSGFSLASVSAQGELALMRPAGTMPIAGSELFKAPVSGGVPVAVEKGAMSADWTPDGGQMAIVRAAEGRNHLEFPPGRVLHATAGWLSHIRFSPDGRRIAFLDHPARHDDAGTVRMVDLATPAAGAVTLSRPWSSVRGLAWRDHREIWIAAADSAAPASLWAVSTTGATRPLAQFPGTVGLRDVSPSRDGLALLSRETRRLESVARLGSKGPLKNISWLDWTRAVEVDDQGRVLFDESGEAVGGRSVTFLASRDGVARLGDGVAMGFTRDGQAALVLDNADRTRLFLAPLGGGTGRELPRAGLSYQWAKFYPDGRRLLALASSDPKQALRLWTVDPARGTRVALTEPGMVRHAAISPKGDAVALLASDGQLQIATHDGPPPRRLATTEPLAPIEWSRDGEWLFVQHLGSPKPPARVSRLHAASGRLEHWDDFGPQDPAGVDSVTRVLITPSGGSVVYTYRRVLSELFLASGLR